MQLREKSQGMVLLQDWFIDLELNGQTETFELTDLMSGSRDVLNTSVRCEYQIETDKNSISLALTLSNLGSAAVRLGRATLLRTADCAFGAADAGSVVLPYQSGQMLQTVYRVGDTEDPGRARIKAQFYNPNRQTAVQVGFVTFQRMNAEVHYQLPADTQKLSVQAWCDFAGFDLEPGNSVSTETIRLAWGHDPYAQMEDWAKLAAALIQPQPEIWPEPPIGYLGWSWADPINGTEDYETVTLANIDAINRRLAGFGVRYLWTSMTNLDGSLPGHWLRWNHRCIPMGREAFLAALAERGFIQGFWIGPFYISNRPELLEQFGDALLRQADGSLLVVVPMWNHGDSGRLPKDQRPCLYALDPTHPKAQAFIRSVFETYRAWGVRYYMVDFLEAGAGTASRFPYGRHYDPTLIAGPEAYLTFMRIVREAAGPDTYLLGSTGPTMINAGVLDAVRTGSDFGEGRPLTPGTFFYPATYVINRQTFWTGARYALMNHAANFHTHRRFYLNDSGNVLTVDKPLTLQHARLHATIHGFSGGGTMLGDDFRQISDDRLALIKKTLPRAVEAARPLDLFDRPHPQSVAVFGRHIELPWQTYDVILVYNMTAEPQAWDLDLARLGLASAPASAPASASAAPASASDAGWLVWEFWNEAFIGVVRERLHCWVDAESVRVFRLTRDSGEPTLIGTDMHLTMGEMDIAEARYERETKTFRLIARRPAGEAGMAFIHAPNDVVVENFDGLHVAKDGRDQSLVIGVPLVFDETGEARRDIRFGSLAERLAENTI